MAHKAHEDGTYKHFALRSPPPPAGARVDTARQTAYLTTSFARLDPAPEDRAPMIGAFAKRLFGSANDRVIKSLSKTVAAINALEPELEALSDDDLRARTDWLRGRLAAGEDARRPPDRRLRHRARGVQAHPPASGISTSS